MPNNKYVKVELGALDDATVAAEFSVGIALTADMEVSVEAEAEATLSVEVSPEELGRVVSGVTRAMSDEITKVASKGIIGSNGQVLLTAQDATNVLIAGTNFLKTYNSIELGI